VSLVHYLRRTSSFGEANSLFLAGRNAEAVAALRRSSLPESAILTARCLLRLGSPSGSVAALLRADLTEANDAQSAEYHALLATSLVRCGRSHDAEFHYVAAERIARRLGGASRLEVAFYHALDAWSVRNLDRAVEIAAETHDFVPVEPDPYRRSFNVLRSQLLELVSLVAASREDYTMQAALLIEAWKNLARVPKAERDTWVAASILRNLAPLVWDLTLVDEADFLLQAVSTVPWTEETMSARYVATRALAWNSALRGDHIGAFARFRECIDLAPTIPWRIASMLDRAYLASEMRQRVIEQEEMLHGSELAQTVAWESVVGEEAKVLLELAQAYARQDAGLARHWLERYDRGRALPRHLMLLASDDRRQTAMEQDAQAAVLAAEGRADEAVAMRRRALATWDDLDHLWRAARSAIALARLTGTDHDAAAALMRTKTFRCSWLGRAAAATRPSRRARANHNR